MALSEQELLVIREKILRMKKITEELLAQGDRITKTQVNSASLEINELKASLKLSL
jgi:hypothetical protein